MARSLEGIGATLKFENDFVMVAAVVPGGPADKSGQIAIDDTNIFVISSIAPIAQQMLGKSINDQFEMNGLTYTINAIV